MKRLDLDQREEVVHIVDLLLQVGGFVQEWVDGMQVVQFQQLSTGRFV